MVSVSLRELLEAGVHFGHQTGRWNPKMRPFIFGKRNGIYIIDLQQTQKRWNEALEFLERESAQGGKVLFVGTKRQAQNIVAEEAGRCGQYYVNHRWLGGLLTNYQTIGKSIERYQEIEAMLEDGRSELLTKKERLRMERERFKLERNLIGIRDMGGLPDVLFVVDIRRERIAVNEAVKLGIPVVAVVDTNCDPDGIDFMIPGNDDAIRSIRLFCRAAADAVMSGQATYEQLLADQASEAEAKKQAAADAEAAAVAAAEAPAAEPAEEASEESAEAAPAEEAADDGAEAAPAKEAADDSAEAAPAEEAAEESAEAAPAEEAADDSAEAAPAEEAAEETAEAAPAEEADTAEADAEPDAADEAADEETAKDGGEEE